MTEAQTPSGAVARVGAGSRLTWIIVALALGVGAGLLSNVIWPNPVYGYQLYIVLLGLVVAIVGVVSAVAVPRSRRLALPLVAASIGAVAGVYLGMAMRPATPPPLVGSIDVDLDSPVRVQVQTANAVCDVTNGQLVFLETGNTPDTMPLGDGRWLSITLRWPETTGGTVPTFEIRVHALLPDGSPTETVMTSGPASNVSASGVEASGSLAFSALVVSPSSEQREPIDVVGSLRWACPAG